MSSGNITISSFCLWQHVKTIELTMMLLSLQPCYHFINQVINIQQLQFNAGVINSIRQIICKSVAEGGHGTIVVGAAPLAKEVRETVDENTGFTTHRLLFFFILTEITDITEIFGHSFLNIFKGNTTIPHTIYILRRNASEIHRARTRFILNKLSQSMI